MVTPLRNRRRIVLFALAVGSLPLLALLESAQAGSCFPPPAGLVSWWPGEGNALDAQGTNNGVFTSPAYGTGEVGQAFSFDGSGNNVRVPASPVMDVGSGAGMTIEAWIYSTDSSAGRPIFEWVPQAVGAFGTHFYAHIPGPGGLYANLYDTANNSHIIQTGTGIIQNNTYQHVAVTYDKGSGVARLFVNGTLATESVLGTFTPQTSPDVSIGFRPSTVPFGPIPFIGRIDEVSLYSRALSPTEIQAIYNAGTAGKCSSTPPAIYAQPTNQTVIVGTDVSFNVLASGSQPLSYQWTFDGTNLPGATAASLVLTKVQPSQSGVYGVQVTNNFGSIVSSNAILTINPPPPCVPPVTNLVAWWPAEGSANDLVGSDNGTISNGITFVPGMVGQAFNFDGSTGAIVVPSSATLNVQNLTVETWIYPTDLSIPRPIFEYANSTGLSTLNFWYCLGNGAQPVSGALFAAARDGANPNNNFYIASVGGLLPSNQWSHVAFTFDSFVGKAALYLNGSIVAATTLSSPVHPNTQVSVNLGYRPTGSADLYAGFRHKGKLDEVSLYNRALSQSEIQAIYAAGASGKCSAPIAPSIVSQPTNQTALAGSTTYITVNAAGSQPLSYQWSLDGTDLPSGTNVVLTLINIQTNQSGNYAVRVTNSAGSIVSSNAFLTVKLPPPCVAPSAGLVSWWRGEGNAEDNEGANNAVFNGALYGPGEVGQAFSFDGSGNNVRVPSSFSMDVGAGPGMTIEAWIFSTDSSSMHPIVEWVPKTIGAFGVHFYAHAGGQGVLYANLYDMANTSHIIQTPAGTIALNTYQHVAVTYDKTSGIARLFVNGAQITQATLGTFTPQTSPDLSIGYRPNTVPFGPIAFLGRIDEVSLYSRALAASEILAIYNAGGAGKCNVPVPPNIFRQPIGQTETIGQIANFQVQAGGTSPLSYQWSLNGTAIAGATNASLVLTNVQMSQAGTYAVVVTNAYGSATSSNATLVVNFPPASVNVVSSSGTAGQLITVPVVLVANGNENSLGFSLNFSPSLLTNAGVTLGPGSTGALLQFNTNQAGVVGVGIALPSGTTFAPGTQEVAEISFMTQVSAKPFTAALTFGDQPVARQLSDAAAHPLAATFTGGQVSLSRSAFEADVAPRPDGDGTVTIVDWVQVGRYVAALDSPTNASEFQRADCAPRSTLGDGQLTVSDWVQAGRYAAGLDPLTVAGGPTAPSGNQVIIAKAGKRGTNPTREVDVQGPLIFQGQTGTAAVMLQAQGDENAVGFSLSFDPKVVTYINATAGSDASNATMDINANQSTNGQLGIILALPTDISFSPGTRQLVKVNFQAVTGSSVSAPVALTDQPVRREVSDTNALPVVATYANGTISVNPKPSLSISETQHSINLSWPLWATNYSLQEAMSSTLPITSWTNLAVTPNVTTNAITVGLPLSGSVQFYRLKHL